MKETTMDSQMHECIHLCWECRDTCQNTLFNYMLERGGEHMHADTIRRMTDCMEICQTAADFMRRNSPLHVAVCRACAEICEACADLCEGMGKEHAAMQQCADICRRCAASCQEMGQAKKAA